MRKMRKVFSAFVALMTVCVMAVSFTSCQKKSYGSIFNTQQELAAALQKENLKMKYPSYFGEESEKPEYKYAAVKTADEKSYSGYKIYQFGNPFYVSVTAYSEASDTLQSDETSRTEKTTSIESKAGNIDVYAGKGHKDALFLIGCINIDSMHYEVRVTSNEDMENNEYIHAIYENNEYYQKALKTISDVIESIK